jgi:hypothetical protein
MARARISKETHELHLQEKLQHSLANESPWLLCFLLYHVRWLFCVFLFVKRTLSVRSINEASINRLK